MTSNHKPIAIIGAGIAGLSCAQRLQAAGLAVEVIEKSRGPGGRSATRRGDGWQADHGAQYFTARHPAFRAAVQQWQEAGVVAPWQGRILAFDGAGCMPVSNREPRFVGTPRMSVIGRHLSEGLAVRYNTRVSALLRDGEDWMLDIAEHGVLDQRYSGLIVTLPAQQAHSLLSARAPDLADIAARSRLRGCWALMVRYADDPQLPFDAAFVNNGGLSWVACDSSKPGRPRGHTWVLHAPAAGDIGGETQAELDAIAEAMMAEFMRLGAPRPDAFTLHRWRFANNAEDCSIGSLWAPTEHVGMAGDWLHGGRVEGAWLSGRQLADDVIAAANQNTAYGSNSTP